MTGLQLLRDATIENDVLSDVPQFAVGVLADSAKQVERVFLVDLALVHDDAHRHPDATVAVSGEGELADLGPESPDLVREVRFGAGWCGYSTGSHVVVAVVVCLISAGCSCV